MMGRLARAIHPLRALSVCVVLSGCQAASTDPSRTPRYEVWRVHAGATTPQLLMTAAAGSANGAARSVVVDGNFDFANALEVGYPIDLLVFQGSTFARSYQNTGSWFRTQVHSACGYPCCS